MNERQGPPQVGRTRRATGKPRPRRAGRVLAAAVAGLVLCTGCTQNVRVDISPKPGLGEAFVVVEPNGMDRRYMLAGSLRAFPTGSVVNFTKSRSPRIAVVDDQGARTYEETLMRFPMRWYEILLTPLFGLGYALWHPYPNPYIVNPVFSGDERLRQAAQMIAAKLLAAVPRDAKVVGVFTVETDIVEKGASLPYASEGNRRLSEYVCNALRSMVPPALQIKEYKMGVNFYLKHTADSLGASVEARRELIAKLALDERLDVAVYGKNYLYPQSYSTAQTINRCRFEFDILAPTAERTVTMARVEHIFAIDPNEFDLIRLFLPPQRPSQVTSVRPPSIEVTLERAAKHVARDLLEKFQGVVLAQYPKPIFTYVSDFAFLANAPLDERNVVPNRYGAYLTGKVEQQLAAGSTGLFAFVARKKVNDVLKGVPNRGKTVMLREMSAWIDPNTAPQLGRKVGAKLVFFGDMQVIGGDLNVTVWLQDIETDVKLATVEHKITLDQFLHAQFVAGNLTP